MLLGRAGLEPKGRETGDMHGSHDRAFIVGVGISNQEEQMDI